MKKKYHYLKKNQANLRAAFRGAVSVYLVCLAVRTVRGVYQDPYTTMPVWAAWLVGALFAAVAVGFGLYTWKRYQSDLRDAELPEEEHEGDE